MKEVAAHHSNSEENLILWLNLESIRKIKKHAEGISLDAGTKSLEICDICVEGKQTKLPHNQHRHRATRPLQFVHSDHFGPVTPTSHDGKTYILTFIDDFTYFIAAYALKTKSEVFKFFNIYEVTATAHFICENKSLYER